MLCQALTLGDVRRRPKSLGAWFCNSWAGAQGLVVWNIFRDA